MASYEEMTIEQLLQLNQELAHKREELRNEQKAIGVVLDKKAAEREARRKLEAMSEPEKAALRQMLSPSGVASEEAVGKPGAA